MSNDDAPIIIRPNNDVSLYGIIIGFKGLFFYSDIKKKKNKNKLYAFYTAAVLQTTTTTTRRSGITRGDENLGVSNECLPLRVGGESHKSLSHLISIYYITLFRGRP